MKIAVFIILQLAASSAFGQSFPKSDRNLILADAVAKSFDAYFTHIMLVGKMFHNNSGASWTFRSVELDPVARPFVKTTAGQVGFFSATLAADVMGAYLCRRTGHRKLEKLFLEVGVGYSTAGAIDSAHAYTQIRY